MKAVMISIQPKWCDLIASGKKTVEVRKSKPNIAKPFKCYIYETQGKTDQPWIDEDGHIIFKGRGQVIGEFVCDEIVTAEYGSYCVLNPAETLVQALELLDYANGKKVYGWHISDLVIYDKPKELDEFKKHNRTCHYDHLGLATPKCKDCKGCQLTRPPQSWCYVESGEGDTDG